MTETNPDRLPTAAQALTQAYQRLQLGNAADAEVWIALARELREGTTPPLITRWLEASRPGDRLTLHDVEGIVCAHGRVAIRPKRPTAARWFMHTDDGTSCDNDDAGREHLRRRADMVRQGTTPRATTLDESERFAKTGKLDPPPHPADAILYGAIPKAAPRHYANNVMHVVPHEPAKVVPPDATQTMPRDLRLDLRIEDDPAKTAQLEAPGRKAAAGLCQHCHFEIYEAAPAQPEIEQPASYLHTMTGQAVCHVRTQPGQPVTLASPRDAGVASSR